MGMGIGFGLGHPVTGMGMGIGFRLGHPVTGMGTGLELGTMTKATPHSGESRKPPLKMGYLDTQHMHTHVPRHTTHALSRTRT